ncbi:peroxiredoxin-like family protein [uncultured Lacinutrix sp.]|uniref:peroxiredoxin-like family protein n=1 Tax=uncultured Lacinutrix sp. TaxID=574032 RepID=UPI00260AA8E1|nr:peroxiredoxin-like family protein [uncultured Lacinutrix sp.]
MMSLTQLLKEHADESAAKFPEEIKVIMRKAIDELEASKLVNKALKTGDIFPSFNLPNASGNIINSLELLDKGPLVITFYRGGWCPYCNIELKALQNVLPQIQEKGAELIAISPESPDNSLSTKEKNELSFEVLTDKDNSFARDLSLVYKLPKDLVSLYRKFGINLDNSQNNTNSELPIAATYVIDSNGKIKYHFLKEDYKLRADPKEILEAL